MLSVCLAPILRRFFLCSVSCAFSLPVWAGWNGNQGSGTPEDPYEVPAVAAHPRIDGLLEDDAWSHALKLEMAWEVAPREDVPATVKTDMLLVHDRSALFVAFRCYDPDPSAIVAHLREHDNVGSDDWIGVVLDTFNDERRSYNFITSAGGVQYEEVQTGPQTDPTWDTLWGASARITSSGYSVEMVIPFSSLRFQRTDGEQVWGIDAERFYPRGQSYRTGLFRRNLNNNCYHCQFIKIRGFNGVSPGRNMELNPTMTAQRTEARSGGFSGGFEKRVQETEIGMTARWGVTPNLTLSGTRNPDFSQVEADAVQLDINQPFALFYQERRPFFTEGADYFETPLQAVYTRTVRDPIWGFKLTGKEGPNTIGMYVVRDEITNLIFPASEYSDQTSLDMKSVAPVFRYRRDIGNQYTIGALATAREGEEYHNRVAGVDGDLRVTDKDRITFQILGSRTRYPDEVASRFGQDQGDFGGRALQVRYVHATRSLTGALRYEDLDGGFRADLGFMPQVDYRRAIGSLGYRWFFKPGGFLSGLLANTDLVYGDDQKGAPLERQLHFGLSGTGAMRSSFGVSADALRRTFNGVEFDIRRCGGELNVWPNGNTTFGAGIELGDDIDYAGTRPARVLRAAPRVGRAFGPHLRVNVFHLFERLTVDQGRLYTANVSQLQANYQFNARTAFRSILQYVNYDFNPDVYAFPVAARSERLMSQHLFSYEVNPRTLLYVGYSDNSAGNDAHDLTQLDRSLFVKLGYAWVL